MLDECSAREFAIGLGKSLCHVGEAYAETVVVGADQRIRSLKIDVGANQHQRALRVAEIDSSGGICENHGANAHAAEHADRKRDLLRGVALVEMDASLH